MLIGIRINLQNYSGSGLGWTQVLVLYGAGGSDADANFGNNTSENDLPPLFKAIFIVTTTYFSLEYTLLYLQSAMNVAKTNLKFLPQIGQQNCISPVWTG
jgi:hypothetical protein